MAKKLAMIVSAPAVTATPGSPLPIRPLADSSLETEINMTTATILHVGVSVVDTETNALKLPENASNSASDSKYTML